MSHGNFIKYKPNGNQTFFNNGAENFFSFSIILIFFETVVESNYHQMATNLISISIYYLCFHWNILQLFTLKLKTKLRIFNACLKPTLLYGGEITVLSRQQLCNNRCLRGRIELIKIISANHKDTNKLWK